MEVDNGRAWENLTVGWWIRVEAWVQVNHHCIPRGLHCIGSRVYWLVVFWSLPIAHHLNLVWEFYTEPIAPSTYNDVFYWGFIANSSIAETMDLIESGQRCCMNFFFKWGCYYEFFGGLMCWYNPIREAKKMVLYISLSLSARVSITIKWSWYDLTLVDKRRVQLHMCALSTTMTVNWAD